MPYEESHLREKIREAERVPATKRLRDATPDEKGGDHVNLDRAEPITSAARRREGPDTPTSGGSSRPELASGTGASGEGRMGAEGRSGANREARAKEDEERRHGVSTDELLDRASGQD